WAGGQVLARWLLDHPAAVRGKRVLDFGCGSGVVAIAAALAGAASVVACDTDGAALEACRENAVLNGVRLELLWRCTARTLPEIDEQTEGAAVYCVRAAPEPAYKILFAPSPRVYDRPLASRRRGSA
ncbi:MAG: 50S ribosomal protein L11 methyltransferase, partial [Myxococcota bacterium]